MRLLLVEDDQNLGLSLQQALRQEGHAANWIPDAKSARGALETEQYDLLIVDLALPDSTGLDLIQDVRKTKSSNALILALGDRLDKNARINALDAGADDYLLKPFGLDELRANIRALVRRQAGRPASELIYGPIRLDPASRNVSVHGNAVDLTPREFAMLEVLLENAGRIVSKSRLEETLYAWDEEVESNAVEVHVHRLRKKLGADFIRTVRGVGYAISGEAVAQPTGEVQPAGHPLPQHGPGEFEPLLGMLDQIFKRLQQDLDHERNVCTETAQILRRPLNAIKLQAELALRSDDPKIRALTLNNILRATDRAQSLLDSLAAVIGLERDKVPTLNRQVALCEICEQVTAELEPGAHERGIVLSLATPCEGIIWGDGILLSVLIRQLLESVLMKSPSKRHIEISVTQQGDFVRLAVRGRGGEPATNAAEPQRAPARLHVDSGQQPQSRWSHGRRSGSTLVERIVELHSGRLSVARNTAEQPCIELEFPSAVANKRVEPQRIRGQSNA